MTSREINYAIFCPNTASTVIPRGFTRASRGVSGRGMRGGKVRVFAGNAMARKFRPKKSNDPLKG
jgi:hypothetical protein